MRSYLSGFNGSFESEAIEGALPVGQNNPQKCPFGLYAEQLNGTAFTAPRSDNKRTWFYRIRPSVTHEPYKPVEHNYVMSSFIPNNDDVISDPNQLRWSPFLIPSNKTDFVQGLRTICGSGDSSTRNGLAVHIYVANANMDKKVVFRC
jgi:homogentisate 1,2-dioxygenase